MSCRELAGDSSARADAHARRLLRSLLGALVGWPVRPWCENGSTFACPAYPATPARTAQLSSDPHTSAGWPLACRDECAVR
eukprot:362891-Chlamydomonas_euryale.AAC.2